MFRGIGFQNDDGFNISRVGWASGILSETAIWALSCMSLTFQCCILQSDGLEAILRNLRRYVAWNKLNVWGF